jgi:hypothetical protein
MGFDENEPGANGFPSEFKRGLSELGWTDGRNMRMDFRWEARNVDRMRVVAKELVNLQPHHRLMCIAASSHDVRLLGVIRFTSAVSTARPLCPRQLT